jgi:hypothetical protein
MNHPSAGSQSEPPFGSPILGPAVPPSADARLPLIIDEDLGPLTSSDYRRHAEQPEPSNVVERLSARAGSGEGRHEDGGGDGDQNEKPDWLIHSERQDDGASLQDASESDLPWVISPQAEDVIGGGAIASDDIIPIERLLPDDVDHTNQQPGGSTNEFEVVEEPVWHQTVPAAQPGEKVLAEGTGILADEQRLEDGAEEERGIEEAEWYRSEPVAFSEGDQSSADWGTSSDDDATDSEEQISQDDAFRDAWRSEDEGIDSEPGFPDDAAEFATPIPATGDLVTTSAVLEEIASRLERIADSLRNRDGATTGDGDDPLEVLITGYALGYTEGARRASEGQSDGI